jgi:hypothetical protein
MEVKKIPIVELKYRRAHFPKRGVSAKYLQKRRDAVKRRTFHLILLPLKTLLAYLADQLCP